MSWHQVYEGIVALQKELPSASSAESTKEDPDVRMLRIALGRARHAVAHLEARENAGKGK